MVYHKNYLEVDKEIDMDIYRIMMDLKKHGKSIVETGDTWESTSRKLGVRTKPLIENNLLYPIARTKNNRKYSIALIQTPNNVKVMEKNINKMISRFIFKKH